MGAGVASSLSGVNYSVLVDVTLRAGIERALPALGFSGVSNVRAGKSFRMNIEADSESEALAKAKSLAERLLSNPVMEDSVARLAQEN